jgi:hypothetical protein
MQRSQLVPSDGAHFVALSRSARSSLGKTPWKFAVAYVEPPHADGSREIHSPGGMLLTGSPENF